MHVFARSKTRLRVERDNIVKHFADECILFIGGNAGVIATHTIHIQLIKAPGNFRYKLTHKFCGEFRLLYYILARFNAERVVNNAGDHITAQRYDALFRMIKHTCFMHFRNVLVYPVAGNLRVVFADSIVKLNADMPVGQHNNKSAILRVKNLVELMRLHSLYLQERFFYLVAPCVIPRFFADGAL